MKYTNHDLMILSKTIYGEARGELSRFGLASLIAVANVIVNRVRKKFALTVADVCLSPHQFSCWNKYDPNYTKIKNLECSSKLFQTCLMVAKKVLYERLRQRKAGATHLTHQYQTVPSLLNL